MPRTTTALSRISVTAPAPRVVYQRTLLDTGQREAPETATPPPDEEPTPLEDFSPLDEEDEDEEDEDVDVLDEVEVLEVAEVAVSLDAEEELVPGMVAALTAPKTPTPATAANAAPNVRRLSSRIAASRARTRMAVWSVLSMGYSLAEGAKPHLRAR